MLAPEALMLKGEKEERVPSMKTDTTKHFAENLNGAGTTEQGLKSDMAMVSEDALDAGGGKIDSGELADVDKKVV